MNEFIHLRHVNKKYACDNALIDVSLDLPSKGFVALVGESGSGKSTLLNLIAGLLNGFGGLAMVDGVNLGPLDENSRRDYRCGRIGFLDQNVSLLDSETALANVKFPLDSIFECTRKEKESRAKDLLRFVGMENLTYKNVNEMSGGQRQRVGLAACLAADPKIVLADEPTAALDSEASLSVMQCLSKISASRLVIVVSHDESLVSSFATRIVRLKDGRIIDDRVLDNEKESGQVLALQLNKKKQLASPTQQTLLLHAFHVLGRRKIRSLFMLGSLVASFLGVSAGVYLTDSIEHEVAGAFSSIVPPGRIVVAKKGGGEAGYQGLTAASELQVLTLEDTFSDLILGSGQTLLFDFASLFSTSDDFSFLYGAKRVACPSLSSRNINEFLWLEETYPEVFPSFPLSMDIDDVVLGLPFSDMVSLCFDLGIERNYQSLGEVCSSGLRLLVELANESISFHNEDLFSVVGVVRSSAPCIYHLNRDWNEVYFLDHLNFRSSISDDTLNPQSVFSLPYIVLKADEELALSAFREKGFCDEIVFDFSLPSYLSSLTAYDWHKPSSRAYLYSAFNGRFRLNDVLSMMEAEEVRGAQLCSNGSYLSFTDNLVSGFANAFYLSPRYDEVFMVGETVSTLPKSEPLSSIALPSSVKDGNYLSTSRGGLHISSDFSGLKPEEIPRSLREIVISSSLDRFWESPETLYAAIEYVDPNGADKRKVTFFEFSVKAIMPTSVDTIFLPSFWANDFFALKTGTTSLALSPTSAVLYCQSGEEGELVASLSQDFPDYDFVDPTTLIDSSFGGATDYISLVLIAFSSILFLLSIVVFAYAISLYRLELAGEWRFFRLLGLRKQAEKRALFSLSFGLTALSLLPSIVGLAMVEVLGHLFISSAFASPIGFAFSFLPFAVMLGLGAFFLLLAYVLTRGNGSFKNRQN